MIIGCSLPSLAPNPTETIQSIGDVMFDRPLDFITSTFDETSPATLYQLKQQHPLASLGVELGTTLLSSFVSSTSLIEQLQSLRAMNLLDVVVIAANPFTNYLLPPILSWARAQNITTIAHDIFRGHPRSPGLFLPPSVSRQRGPSANASVKIDEALDQFRQCLDSCVQMEKTFVEKVSRLPSPHRHSLVQLPKRDEAALVPLKPLFLGFTLANSQHQILFAEEWDFIKNKQVNPPAPPSPHLPLPPQIAPAYEKAIKEFERGNSEAVDFVRLYVPLRRNLIRAFESLLFVSRFLPPSSHPSRGPTRGPHR
jgi:hypothetical protein